MKHLLPLGIIVVLAAVICERILLRRSLRLLSAEQKALVLDASAQGSIWVPACLAVFVAALVWLPYGIIPPSYRTGVLASYILVPFLVSVAGRVSTLMRISRLGLPREYVRSALLRAVVFHAALLFLIFAAVGEAWQYARSRQQPPQSSNQAIQRTAGRSAI